LGRIGEPAAATILEPWFQNMSVPDAMLYTTSDAEHSFGLVVTAGLNTNTLSRLSIGTLGEMPVDEENPNIDTPSENMP